MRIVFVCTGNTCRSPMAEAILKDYLKKNNISGVSVSSCGLHIDENNAYTEEKAIVALKNMGIPIRRKKAKAFSDKMRSFDYIITMTTAQKNIIDAENVHTLGELSSQGDIPDPYGADQSVYDVTAFKIRLQIESMMNAIRGEL